MGKSLASQVLIELGRLFQFWFRLLAHLRWPDCDVDLVIHRYHLLRSIQLRLFHLNPIEVRRRRIFLLGVEAEVLSLDFIRHSFLSRVSLVHCLYPSILRHH